MNIIHYSTVFRRLDEFVEIHNSNSKNLSQRLRQSVIATAKEIIKIYSVSLLKAHKILPLDLDNIPPLETNSVQLATMSNVSARTIRRHIRRLLDANVLTEKVFKGRKSNYELRFNSNILLISGVQAVKKHENSNKGQKIKSTDNQFFKKPLRTTCPQPDPSNNSYTNNLIIDVDKKLNLNNQRSSHALTDDNKTGYTERKKRLKKSEPAEIAQDAPGGEKITPIAKDAEREKWFRVLKDKQSNISVQNNTRTASLNFYVNALWETAKSTIYNNVFLTENQVLRAKELLQAWYKPVKEDKLSKVHKIYLERLELVQKYLEKDTKNRFVQLPHRYFDPKNRYGFTGTKIWYENQARSKRKTRLKLIVHAQIRRFLANEKKDTTNQKPRLELFRQCETRIGNLNNPELLNQFYSSILDKNTFNFRQLNT